MRRAMLVFVLWCCSAVAYAGVDLKTDCTGFSGKSSENGVDLYFDSCPTSRTYQSRLWKRVGKSVEMMTELHYDKDTQTLTYKIAGILVTGSNTPSEEAQMIAALTSPESALARNLVSDLEDLGLALDSPRMRGIRGNIVGYPEFGLPIEGPPPEPVCSGTSCCDEATDCLGCCAYGCFGCVACSTGCLIHDTCVRETGGPCLGWALMAIMMTVDPIAGGVCLC